MENEAVNEALLIQYLLGELDEEAMRKIEANFFIDEMAFDELQVAENELIDRYLAGTLSRHERHRFETFFLSSPGRKERLRFARILQKYISHNRVDGGRSRLERLYISRSRLRKLLVSPAGLAAAIALILGIVIGLWAVFYQSPHNKVLASLSNAYRDQRPFESRIVGLKYAPLLQERGSLEPFINRKERDRAELIALNEVADHPKAESYYSLGQVYLTEQKFDEAIEEFGKALVMDPNNAQINSDLGAALFERARRRASPNERPADLIQARAHFDKALEPDSSLLAARFNRGLWYEYMSLHEKAYQDWQTYLENDPNSKWADEIREKLKVSEQERNPPSRSKAEIFDDFIDAYKMRDDQRAWQAFNQSRARTGNVITEKLLDDFLALSEKPLSPEASREISTLLYAGELEAESAKDLFTKDLARFYKLTNPAQRKTLAQARALLKSAGDHFKLGEYEQAGGLFSNAERRFEQAGDSEEAVFAQIWQASCYLRTAPQRSLLILERLLPKLQEKRYRWLFAQALNSLADAHTSKRDFSEALRCAKQSLEISEEIGDLKGALRNLQLPVLVNQQCGDYLKSLGLILSAFDFARTLSLEPQELWTFYHQAASNLCSLGHPRIASDFQDQALGLAVASGMPLLKARSLGLSGLIHQKLGEYQQALDDIQLALAEAQKITGEKSRTNLIASSFLSLAEIYMESKNYTDALDYYNKAIQLHQRLDVDIYTFQAHKGKLSSLIELHDDDGASKEIEVALPAVEAYRPKIKEEHARNNFFDLAQSIYDLAIDFTQARLNDSARAFNYSEISHARSLLEMVGGTVQLIDEPGSPEIKLESSTRPLTLAEIRQRLPEQSQIVQYSVLDNKLLIWVISREDFHCEQQQIDVDELNGKIKKFWELVAKQKAGSSDEAIRYAQDLYTLLISPIEPFLDSRKQICIVPDKYLNYVPFTALMSANSNRYLIQDYMLELAPSSSIFIACTERAVDKEKIQLERLLSVGDPSFDRKQFDQLPYLTSAALEAEAISKYYSPAITLLREEATESRVKIATENANVIHFAAHYLIDDRSPMLSKLLLAEEPAHSDGDREPDGLLQAYEIYKLSLPQTRLVVLSGCQTGVEHFYRGEGAISFARPFIKAGVPVVVASLWPIETRSASELMVEFHRLRKQEGLSSVEALRAAQLKFIEDSDADHRNPYFWAPFTAIGGYARF
ncbi:MAG TPA: CHAT domain-containing protein [Blastocatellia bacterium]|nr:CHAT domain-containing protein [Blastocatellia bacterium]